jgi:DNA topoisomerase-1
MIVYRYHSGITEEKLTKDNKYVYKDIRGREITNPEILEYVKKLVIPPAYKDVKIFVEKSPKILYEGYDDKGRKQQIYSTTWVNKATKKKFSELLRFGRMLPKITLDINNNIKKKRLTKEKLISLIIKIISICYFRVGNEKYFKLYGSFGISNIKKSHVKIDKEGMTIEFIGKKGVKNTCIVTDELLIRELGDLLIRNPGSDYLFTTGEETIRAVDVNNWLKSYHPTFTSKMFRTFDSNVLLIDYLKKVHSTHTPFSISIAKRKKNVVEAMKIVSDKVNNTPAICKKNYVSNDLINIYVEMPKKYKKEFINSNTSRVNFINFLERNYE